MGSPITLSGFNNIDFGSIVTAIMQQDSQPLTALQQQQTDLQSEKTAFSTLAVKLGAVDSAAVTLSSASNLTAYTASSTDNTTVTATATSAATAGTYAIVVGQLAQAQVTASTTTAPDADTTVVATSGSLTIGGTLITIPGPVTLTGLAEAINGSAAPVTAAVVQTAPSAFQLVLTGKQTGSANAFSITNGLTGGTGVAFGGNAVSAADASLSINNIPITSSSNTITTAIPGVTLSLQQANPAKTVTVNVAPDNSNLQTSVSQFMTTYNALVDFINSQSPLNQGSDATSGQSSSSTGSIGNDTLLRSLPTALSSAVNGFYGSGTFTSLAQVGIGFDQTGHLVLDQGLFNTAVQTDPAAVRNLFTGSSNDGAFSAVDSLVTSYTNPGGLLPLEQGQINTSLSNLGTQISDEQARLAVEKTSLQQEFTAADQAISQLNQQSASLSQFGSQLSSSPLVQG